MRRSDHDITDTVATTDPRAVAEEIGQLFRDLYQGPSGRLLQRSFADIENFYSGRHPDFHACDTSYHDVQHVMDVALTMARLMDGYERSRRNGTPALPPEAFVLGMVAALFHDFGYLRRRNDYKHRYGAEYTRTHVSRGAQFLRRHLERLGLKRHASLAGRLIHFTGYEQPVETIRISDPLYRRMGHMLGTADIIAQMSDRCYLEKCRDRLYPEFVLGGLTHKPLPNGDTEVVFASGEDLVCKTPNFYKGALYRLDVKLGRAYLYADHHFRGQNPYLEEIQRTIGYAETMARASTTQSLRREPPWTLAPGVDAHPDDPAARNQ